MGSTSISFLDIIDSGLGLIPAKSQERAPFALRLEEELKNWKKCNSCFVPHLAKAEKVMESYTEDYEKIIEQTGTFDERAKNLKRSYESTLENVMFLQRKLGIQEEISEIYHQSNFNRRYFLEEIRKQNCLAVEFVKKYNSDRSITINNSICNQDFVLFDSSIGRQECDLIKTKGEEDENETQLGINLETPVESSSEVYTENSPKALPIKEQEVGVSIDGINDCSLVTGSEFVHGSELFLENGISASAEEPKLQMPLPSEREIRLDNSGTQIEAETVQVIQLDNLQSEKEKSSMDNINVCLITEKNSIAFNEFQEAENLYTNGNVQTRDDQFVTRSDSRADEAQAHFPGRDFILEHTNYETRVGEDDFSNVNKYENEYVTALGQETAGYIRMLEGTVESFESSQKTINNSVSEEYDVVSRVEEDEELIKLREEVVLRKYILALKKDEMERERRQGKKRRKRWWRRLLCC